MLMAHLQPATNITNGDTSLPYSISDLKYYSLAVSGDVFRWIVDYGSPTVLKRMLVAGRVFARMSPDEKHELVEKLQSIGYTAGFCGDGANDCGALKAADVGISLSEAEASVAAPFTSRVFDIGCVPQVIREGRAALVTSFACFKYMSLYSAIQFTSVSFLYASASNLGDFQFLFIDLALILPIAVLMSWAGPAPTLSRKRPTADLVSKKVLTPLLGQMAVCVWIQAIAWLAVRKQEWYIPPHVNPEKSNIKNSENTTLFLISCFEYILAGVVLNAGPPFRQRARQNCEFGIAPLPCSLVAPYHLVWTATADWNLCWLLGPFLLAVGTALVFTTCMLLDPWRLLRKRMQLTEISWDFKWYLLFLGGVYLAVAWVGENFVFIQLARLFGHSRQKLTGKTKKRKEYKVILEEMRW